MIDSPWKQSVRKSKACFLMPFESYREMGHVWHAGDRNECICTADLCHRCSEVYGPFMDLTEFSKI